MNVKCPGCGKNVRISDAQRACPKCGRPFAGAVGGTLSRGSEPDAPEVYVPAGRKSSPFAWLTDNSNLLMMGAIGLVGFMILIGIVVLIAARPWDRMSASSNVPPPTPPPRRVAVASPPVAPVTPPPPEPTTTVAPPPPPFLFLTRLKPVKPVVLGEEAVTDQKIGAALDKSTQYLLSLFESGNLKPDPRIHDDLHDGIHALAVYALLHASTTLADERLKPTSSVMGPMIDAMKKLPMQTRPTYARAMRIGALALLNRPGDRRVIEDDVQYLLRSSVNGGFGYEMPKPNEPKENLRLDSSNSQYGALGLWLASDAGIYVPKTFWRDVETYWTGRQTADGRWPYINAEPVPAMTAAGINALLVARIKLADESRMARTGLPPYSPALQKGLDWLNAGDNAITLPSAENLRGYMMYTVERVGLASGFRYFGAHDWYRALAGQVLTGQLENGSWDGYYHPAIETSLITLTLTRGRHTVAISKLKYPGGWANRPDDALNLVTFIAKQVERPLNWQVADLDQNWRDWLETPVLLLSGHEKPAFLNDPKYVEGLKAYVDAGGLIFTNSDNESGAFTESIAALARYISDGSELAPLPPDHPLYNALFNIKPTPAPEVKKSVLPLLSSTKPTTQPAPEGRPVLWGVSRGARLLLVHSPSDVARRWQEVDDERGGKIMFNGKDMKAAERQRNIDQHQFSLEAAANVFIYAAGRRDYRNRLESPYIAPPPGAQIGEVPLARLKYEGQWQPEPQAWDRQSRWMQAHTSIKLKPLVCDLEKLKFPLAPIAHLTGTGPRKFSVEEVDAVRDYVTTGGVLLVDGTGGNTAFVASVRDGLFASAFPQDNLTRIDKQHPILAGDGKFMPDLREPLLNDFSNFTLRDKDVRPSIFFPGAGAVILSDLDLTTALLGGRTFGYNGFESDYATNFVNNVILWAISREELKVAGVPTP